MPRNAPKCRNALNAWDEGLSSRAPIAADFEEQRTEVFVINVEVAMVDVDRLITIELKPPVHLFPVERLGFLLCHPDEDNPVAHLSLPAEVVGNVVFPGLVVVERGFHDQVGAITSGHPLGFDVGLRRNSPSRTCKSRDNEYPVGLNP